MIKKRLDQALADKKLVSSRSQAESFIKLGKVTVDGKVVTKPGTFVSESAKLSLNQTEKYVSRAGLKLASVAQTLKLDFKDAVVLDVGSSTGGFTDYALKRGAERVIAVDVGTDQLHPSLRNHSKIELYEKTDIRYFQGGTLKNDRLPTIIVIDISFMSLRLVLPHIAKHLAGPNTQIVAMLKPQFEAGKEQTHKGVIKNNAVRRDILKYFETWAQQYFVIKNKKDSDVTGAKGNQERFYLLELLTH